MTLLLSDSPVGHQRPRILLSPRSTLGAANAARQLSSAGEEVIDLAESAGLILDPWQKLVLEHGLDERRSDGRWAAREVALVVSRQNGKGSILEALELGDLFLLDTELTIHSAHWFPTSQEALRRLKILIESTPYLDRLFTKYQGKIRESNGKEGIELFRDGKWRRLKFQTRTKSGGRGLTGDRVVIDEAMIYDADMDGALRPTLSARNNAQIWLLGSAGDKESVIFGKARNRGLEGKDTRLVYMEWSCDVCSQFCPHDCTEHDPYDDRRGLDALIESYAKANPGLGIRISVEACESERMSMDSDMFKRERLGVGDWPIDGDAWQCISKESWMNRLDELSQANPPFVLGVDTTPTLSHSCIVVCGRNHDNFVHTEITSDEYVLDHRTGTDWVIPRISQIWERARPTAVVIDKGSQAGRYIPELEYRGIKVLSPSVREYAQACGTFYTSVVPQRGNEPDLIHIGQSTLTNAVAGAATRQLADVWAWDKRTAIVDISPLVAATHARWGLMKMETEAPTAAPWVVVR